MLTKKEQEEVNDLLKTAKEEPPINDIQRTLLWLTTKLKECNDELIKIHSNTAIKLDEIGLLPPIPMTSCGRRTCHVCGADNDNPSGTIY